MQAAVCIDEQRQLAKLLISNNHKPTSMSDESSKEVSIPLELIERRIYLIRGHKVVLDRDLAEPMAWKRVRSSRRYREMPGDSPRISCSSSTKASLKIGDHKL